MASKVVMTVVAALLAAGVASAQDEKKRAGALGLISIEDLKTKVGMDEEQVKKCEAVFTEYKDKLAEAQKKIKEAEDKKAAAKDAGALRTEVLGKLREVCKDDEQKKKFDEASAPQRKKKTQ